MLNVAANPRHAASRRAARGARGVALIAVLALALLAGATPSYAQVDEVDGGESAAFRTLGWLLIGSAPADVLTTHYTLRAGGVEAVPYMPEGGAGLVASKAAASGVAWWATDRLYKRGDRKLALGLRIAIVAAWGYAAAHNIRVMNDVSRR